MGNVKTSGAGGVRSFVVAVKRGRQGVPKDWILQIQHTKGVSVQEPTNPRRILVTGSSDAVETACKKLSKFVYFEELIPHELA